MTDPFNDHQPSHWIPFADFLAGVLAIFLVVAVLLTFHLTQNQKTKDADIQSPGSISVIIVWKEDVDVDLWIKTPDDVPVGYSRKQGTYMDLLRDDLGRPFERVGDHHMEDAFARAVPPGQYDINVHLYRNRDNSPYPIKVDIVTTIMRKTGDSKDEDKKTLKATVELQHEGQEITVMRFNLDSNAVLDEDSVNSTPIELRSYQP